MSDETRERRLKAMKIMILQLERENLKTKAKTRDEMVEAIIRIIKNESKKNY